ncbi:MAG: hypothetical protein ACHQHO_11410 [Solirubrobacterales bacterium]
MGEAPGESRSTYGLLVAALGAVLLAVSVFLPWYGVSFTARGIATAERAGEQFTAQYGNAALQSHLGSLHASLTGLVNHELFSLSAHQALSTLNVVLLILAGLGILIALLALAGPASASSEANRVPLALLGLLGAACIVFRMIDRPSPVGELISLSLREGAWLALLGCICMSAGAIWTRRSPAVRTASRGGDVWSELSGWTPET